MCVLRSIPKTLVQTTEAWNLSLQVRPYIFRRLVRNRTILRSLISVAVMRRVEPWHCCVYVVSCNSCKLLQELKTNYRQSGVSALWFLQCSLSVCLSACLSAYLLASLFLSACLSQSVSVCLSDEREKEGDWRERQRDRERRLGERERGNDDEVMLYVLRCLLTY